MRKIYIITGSIAFAVVAATLLFLDWLSRRASDRFMYKFLKIEEMNNHTFSAQSESHLATCHDSLQLLAREILKEMDIAVVCGHRSEAEQNAAHEAKLSKYKYPKSKHNATPSNAVDIAPYPIDWNDLSRFQQMGEIAKQKAAMLGISIKWGGDWLAFKDYPHIELA